MDVSPICFQRQPGNLVTLSSLRLKFSIKPFSTSTNQPLLTTLGAAKLIALRPNLEASN